MPKGGSFYFDNVDYTTASPFHGHVFHLEGKEKIEVLKKHLNDLMPLKHGEF